MVDVLIDVLSEIQVQEEHAAIQQRRKKWKALIDVALAAQQELGAEWPKRFGLSNEDLADIKANMENFLKVQRQLNRERQAILRATQVGEEDHNFMQRWIRDAEAVVCLEALMRGDAMKGVVAKYRERKPRV